ncbi:MbtH family protein [Xanthomonas hortorum]|uniref:MbtH family protein n=1 Tax=Xanthomonas hortorum TaxID=56454 RepID=UPI0023582915
MSDIDDDQTTYRVVVNHEEQYSIWPATRELPAGWRDAGKQGSKAECLAYIEQVWTDMRPLSLRQHMEEMARNPPVAETEVPVDDEPVPLYQRLADGEHPVHFISRPETSASVLRRSIDRGYVHVVFPNTQGGTELGIRIDPANTDTSKADFEAGSGEVSLAGTLTLDGVHVRCNARLDLATLKGTGHLQLLG